MHFFSDVDKRGQEVKEAKGGEDKEEGKSKAEGKGKGEETNKKEEKEGEGKTTTVRPRASGTPSYSYKVNIYRVYTLLPHAYYFSEHNCPHLQTDSVMFLLKLH